MARVLIVDDEEGIRRTMGMFLENAGHDVWTAGSVSEACELMDAQDFDVVLSDIVMPGDAGIRLLGLVSARMPLTQVIMITGEPTLETATEALRLGAFDYLPKPARKDMVCRVVAKAAHEKELRQENERLNEENRKHREELETLVAERTRELQDMVNQRQAAVERLKSVLRSTTEALSLAIEKRDPYTAGHQRRVAEIAIAIGREMEFAADRLDGLFLAATIHDLGKIAVPADILSKPTRLTVPEFDLIKAHTGVGRDIIKGIEFPWPVGEVILSHHERMGGSGYPRGLQGDEICIEARIVAVADVVEAMVSHRPYRPALGMDKALEEIERNKGKLYDPRVVDACIKVCSRGDWSEGS